MMKITVIPDIPFGNTVSITNEIIAVFAHSDVQILLPESVQDYIEANETVRFVKLEDALSLCDIVIVVGGDGTVTKYASAAAKHKKPVLGINGGHLGFLSGLEKTEIPLLLHLLDGKYKLKSRMLLQADVYDAEDTLISSALCVNDAIIGRGTSLRMVDVSVELDGKLLARHRADGVIIATPTGSTAYSMSAGGPVVDPHMECIIVTPVCSHSLTARSVVCASTSTLVLKNTSDTHNIRHICLTTDSNAPISVPYGGKVVIKKADIPVQFITIKRQSFYEILQEKMVERNITGG
ncbi:MAG: NAD(+)/NADH kinase [Clostridia bacterium]|nr:NAD(+)/NADH kinase [Clostridia bacterium]